MIKGEASGQCSRRRSDCAECAGVPLHRPRVRSPTVRAGSQAYDSSWPAPTPLDSPAASSLWAQAEASRGKHQPPVEDEITAPHVPAIPIANEPRQPFNKEERQHPQELQIRHLTMTIEDVIGAYLLLACRPAGERAATLDRVAARNRSIL
jgi:hypothetical protein